MKKRTGYAVIILFAVSAIILSCQKEVSSNTALDKPHSAMIYLTDHQTPVFDSVFIDIRSLEVKVEDDSLGGDGWVLLSIRPGVYNILRFRNGLDTLFATGTLPSARVRKIRLTLGTQNTAMQNGQSFPLRVKDEDRQVEASLDNSNFEISNGQVFFWIDFDAGNSIQVDNSGSGNNNGFRLKSHIKIFSRGNAGRLEGKVFPRAADPIVKAVIGTDTATAIPEDGGEFKIVGLRAGVYKVIYDGQNGYLDTTLTSITVRTGEDTHLPNIILHQ
ncbi:MAG: DUF4382 domain-containing protein [Chitinophagaceae bacterium]